MSVSSSTRKPKPYAYVLKDNYLQITIAGKPFSLQSTHPTFSRMKSALKKRNWKAIPNLVSVAKAVAEETHGQIRVVNGVVYYKDEVMHSSLADRIAELVRRGKPVKHLIRFTDNLFLNPSAKAKAEFYDWLTESDLPITDDGCFLAYKSVDSNTKDTYTHTIDNSPGQVIMMSRAVADTDYGNQCSTGYHICSKSYGVYGSKTMAVKANPRYILSAVSGKMRVTQYEVIAELGSKTEDLFMLEGFSDLEKKVVVEIGKERKEMVQKLLSLPAVKRAIKKRKMKKSSIMKASFARIKKMFQSFDLVPKVAPKFGPEDSKFLSAGRKTSGLSIGQIAKKMNLSYKTVAKLEKEANPTPERVSQYLLAIKQLTGRKDISYPKPVAK
jgi:hypothetical protein